MIHADFLRSLDRRTFLQIVSLAGISSLIYPKELIASLLSEDRSRVIIVKDDAATTGYSINPGAARRMMDIGIRILGGEYEVGEAWKALFPGIGTSSVVAIKVNTLNSHLPTHPEVTDAVVSGLRQMFFGGSFFPENNIIIYDRISSELSSAGYTLNTSGIGVRCFGTDDGGGYSTEDYDVNGRPENISRIITETADYIVNICVLKSHSIAGVTQCMKNHFGTCDRPSGLHGGDGDPYLPALNSLVPIRDKQCVNICDALVGIATGSQTGYPDCTPNKLVISQDIVATDYWGRDILTNLGATTIPLAHYIETAAQAPYNLGTNDPNQMHVINVTNPVTGTDLPEYGAERIVLEQNYPNPFSQGTLITFYTRDTERVAMTIYDPKGRRVAKLFDRTFGPGWHNESWGGHSNSGLPVPSGVYFLELRAKGIQRTVIMQVIK